MASATTVISWPAFKIDEADVPFFMEHRWFLIGAGYVARGVRENGKNRWIYLHRYLAGAGEGQVVDHINQQKLDNRRLNLRLCTRSQNMGNISRPVGRNPHRGVHWCSRGQVWVARIYTNGSPIYLGEHKALEDAIAARVAGEKEYFGEFAPRRSVA